MTQDLTQDNTEFAKIATLMKGRQFEDARLLLKDRIDAGSNDPLDWYLIARSLFNLKRYSEAFIYYQKCDDSRGRKNLSWYRYARAAYLAGKAEDATIAFRECMSENENVEIVKAYLGVISFQLNQYHDAIGFFRNIAKFTRRNYYFKAVRIFSLILAGKNKSVLYDDLNWPEATLFSGIEGCEKSNDVAGAQKLRAIYEKASPRQLKISKDKLLSVKKSDLSNLYLWESEFSDFVLSCKDDILPNQESSIYYSLAAGRLFLSCQEYKAAGYCLTPLLELQTLTKEDLSFVGECFLKAEMYNQALHIFSRILELDSESPNAYFSLCLTYHALGELDKAAECAKFHLNIVPRDVTALIWLAKYFIQLGLEVLAEQQLTKVDRLASKTTELYMAKDEFRLKFGRDINPQTTLPDYHYIDWSRLSIPSEFQFQNQKIEKIKIEDPFINIKTLFKVMSALILREMTSRFGRSGLGYLWVVIQQLAFISVFAMFFEFRGKSLPYGVEILGFLITGISAFFVFRNTTSQMKGALSKNKSLLYYRQVSPFSIYLARAVLEYSTGIVVFAVLVGVSVALGEVLNMTSLLQVLIVIMMLSLFGASYGLLFASVSIYFPAISSFESSISRILFFTSGLFFYANELPPDLRDILMWNPLFNLIELLREGFFSTYTATHASVRYVAGCTIVFLFFSLVLERVSRNRALSI